MDIKILVAAHKDVPTPNGSDMYFPILVGADRNYNGQKGFQPDNEGENISGKNVHYNELTAIYWAWKNMPNEDAIGLVHYRRFFSLHHRRAMNNILTKYQAEELLKEAPVILPKHRNYIVETNKSHYVHAHHEHPLDVTREVIKKYNPKYLEAFDIVMNSTKASMFNMFIMKWDYFDNYCNFLFGVLERVEDEVDLSQYDVQESRVFGYLGELLMNVWLVGGNIPYKECNWIQLGKRHLVSKAIGFASRKFFGKNDSTRTHF